MKNTGRMLLVVFIYLCLFMQCANAIGNLSDGGYASEGDILLKNGWRFVEPGYTTFAISRDDILYYWGMPINGNYSDDAVRYILEPTWVANDVSTFCQVSDGLLILQNDGVLWYLANEAIERFNQDAQQILEGVTAIASNQYTAYAICAGGTLFAWGSNFLGAAGCGDASEVLIPTPILQEVVSVTPYSNGAFAITADHELWGWGVEFDGQLGRGRGEEQREPMKVFDGVQKVLTHCGAVYALRIDGTAWAWGGEIFADTLERDARYEDELPLPFQIGEDVSDIACFLNHVMLIKRDDSVWTWEWIKDDLSLVGLKPSAKIVDDVAFATGNDLSAFVLDSHGILYSFGDTSTGLLGDGKKDSTVLPEDKVKLLENVVYVNGESFTIGAITEDGTLWMWGMNEYGEVGAGHPSQFVAVPTPVRLPYGQSSENDGENNLAVASTPSPYTQEEAEESEALRQMLADAVDGEIVWFLYEDYDDDGIGEAFALVEKNRRAYGPDDGVWFISRKQGIQRIVPDAYYWGMLEAYGEKWAVHLDQESTGNVDASQIWSVYKGRPVSGKPLDYQAHRQEPLPSEPETAKEEDPIAD